MELQKIEGVFTVCKVARLEDIDFSGAFVFVSKTSEEISLVCETGYTPAKRIASEPGWRALKVSGVLDFGMVGVIAKISNILAEAEMSIFVVSTYNTDYIFLKEACFDRGVQVLGRKGYVIVD